MNGLNMEFIGNPLSFADRYLILAWTPSDKTTIQKASMVDKIKQGNFDFQPTERMNKVKFLPSNSHSGTEQYITAYWCPYITGYEEIGFVDIPKENPAYNFVFTGLMNGCSLVVTDSPDDATGHYRVYHNQHPTDDRVNRLITDRGQTEHGRIDFADYGSAHSEFDVNGFNFLYYYDDTWHFIIQQQTISFTNGIPYVETRSGSRIKFIPIL